jgi:hypothetical protein
MEKTLLERVSGSEIKPYTMSTRGSSVSGSSFVLPPRSFIVLDFSKANAEFCVINFRRDSGNGLAITHCAGRNVEHKITSKTNQGLEFRLRGDKRVHIHRTDRGRGSIAITSLEFYTYRETPVDWNAKLRQCREHACIRLIGDVLHASEGGFIDGDIAEIETDPPGAFVRDGRLIKFVTSCRINKLEIAVAELHKNKIPELSSPPKLRHIDIIPPEKAPQVLPKKELGPPKVFGGTYAPVTAGWHLNIPRVVHFYWGGKLTFLRYASIYSCAKQNPDWQIKLHTPEILGATRPTWKSSEQSKAVSIQDTTENYMHLVKKIPNLEVVKHNFEKYQFKNNAHEVHKSDMLRWILLSTEGGLWSDSDIIYHHPMCVMLDNKPQNNQFSTGLCKYNASVHAIGFLMASKDNAVFREILKFARKSFRPNQYQCVGSSVLNRRFKKTDNRIFYINPATVYSIADDGISKFLSTNTYIQDYPNAIGFHWYGGHPMISELELAINHRTYQTNNTFLGKLVRLAMSE